MIYFNHFLISVFSGLFCWSYFGCFVLQHVQEKNTFYKNRKISGKSAISIVKLTILHLVVLKRTWMAKKRSILLCCNTYLQVCSLTQGPEWRTLTCNWLFPHEHMLLFIKWFCEPKRFPLSNTSFFAIWISNFLSSSFGLPTSVCFSISKHCLPWHESNQVKTHCLRPGHCCFTDLISSQRYGITPFGSMKKEKKKKKKAPCTEVRNWLWLIMHKHQMPWHFLSLPNNHLPLLSVYLQLMIEFQSPPKIPFLLCVCIPNTHSCYQYTRQHAQQSLSPAFRWGPMETVLIISLLLQSTAVCFGIRGFLWRLHMHTHWLQARERARATKKEREGEFFCSITPPSAHPSLPLSSLSTQPTHPPLRTNSLPMPDTLASPGSITSPWCNV